MAFDQYLVSENPPNFFSILRQTNSIGYFLIKKKTIEYIFNVRSS